MMETYLQVALDLTELERAVKIARESVMGGADWIEVGTPLIKSEGMEAVRTFRREFPNHVVVADMKTMDAGAVEVEIAAKSGADVVCVLGEADNSTITDALRSARRYGVKLMGDLIGVENPVERGLELASMGVDIINVHVGIDQQMRGEEIGLDVIERLKEEGVVVAVAGGLDADKVGAVVGAGVDIVIVGSAITRTKDPRKATLKIKEAMKKIRRKNTIKKRREDEILEILRKVTTPNLSDALHRKPAIHVRPITPCKMAGKVLTVATYGGDWAKPVEAIDMAEKGDVIVIASQDDVAVWGELATLSAMKKGLGGVVVHGAIRDIEEIKKLGFPVFARKVVSNAGDPKGFGEIGVEIVIEGQRVKTGDYVLGDENGVVFVPREEAYEAAKRALEVAKLEERLRAEIEEGKTLSEVAQLLRWEKRKE